MSTAAAAAAISWNNLMSAFDRYLGASDADVPVIDEQVDRCAATMVALEVLPAPVVHMLVARARWLRGTGPRARIELWAVASEVADDLKRELDPPGPEQLRW